NRVMGREGRLPWRIPEDAEHFRQLTAGHVCVLGRGCFDTWPDAIRERRQPIGLTTHPLPSPLASSPVEKSRADARQEGSSVPIAARSLGEALAVADTIPGEVFVCGGQRI